MPCPECGHQLRAINSLGINLCDSCGYREDLPPIATTPLPAKKKINYFPLLVMIGVCGMVIAAMVGTTAYQQQKKIELVEVKSRAQEMMEEAEIRAIARQKAEIEVSHLPPICQPKDHQQLNYEMYLNCFPEGTTYSQINQITGKPGTIVSTSGNIKMVQFEHRGDWDNTGYMSVVFDGDRLISKSQFELAKYR